MLLQVLLHCSEQIPAATRKSLIKRLWELEIEAIEHQQNFNNAQAYHESLPIFIVFYFATQRSVNECLITEKFNSLPNDAKGVMVCLISAEKEEEFGRFIRPKPDAAFLDNLYLLSFNNEVNHTKNLHDNNIQVIKELRDLTSPNSLITIPKIQSKSLNHPLHFKSKNIDYNLIAFNSANMIKQVQIYLQSKYKISTNIAKEVLSDSINFIVIYFTNPRSPSTNLIETKFCDIPKSAAVVFICLICYDGPGEDEEMSFINLIEKPSVASCDNIYFRYVDSLSQFTSCKKSNQEIINEIKANHQNNCRDNNINININNNLNNKNNSENNNLNNNLNNNNNENNNLNNNNEINLKNNLNNNINMNSNNNENNNNDNNNDTKATNPNANNNTLETKNTATDKTSINDCNNNNNNVNEKKCGD